MAPREGFEPPRPMDSGFRIHRNTGLCDLGSSLATCESKIRLTGLPAMDEGRDNAHWPSISRGIREPFDGIGNPELLGHPTLYSPGSFRRHDRASYIPDQ